MRTVSDGVETAALLWWCHLRHGEDVLRARKLDYGIPMSLFGCLAGSDAKLKKRSYRAVRGSQQAAVRGFGLCRKVKVPTAPAKSQGQALFCG